MKKHFLRGLVLLFPILFTFVVSAWLFHLITEPIAHLLLSFFNEGALHEEAANLLSLVLLFVFILLLGLVTKIYLFHKALLLVQRLFRKIPLLRSLYNATHEVADTLLREDKRGFSNVVMVRYPSPESSVIGLIPRLDMEICQTLHGGDLVPVLIPGSINPLMGFLVFFHKKDIEYLPVGLEEGLKWYLSVGCIPPKA